jgi:hypothetical protein
MGLKGMVFVHLWHKGKITIGRGDIVNTENRVEQRTGRPTSKAKKRAIHARKAVKPSGRTGLLSKALAVLLALNMAVMFALPAGISADDVTITSGGLEVHYGAASPETSAETSEVTTPEGESVQMPSVPSGQSNLPSALSGFAPLAITQAGPGVVTVDNWADLQGAITNANNNQVVQGERIHTILLTTDISRGSGTNLPAITTSLTINGQGHAIDFGAATGYNGFSLANAATPSPKPSR